MITDYVYHTLEELFQSTKGGIIVDEERMFVGVGAGRALDRSIICANLLLVCSLNLSPVSLS